MTFGLVSATAVANGTTYHSSMGDMYFRSSSGVLGDIVAGRAFFDTPFGDVNVPDALTFGISTLGSTESVFGLDDVPFVPDPADFSSHVFSLIVDDTVGADSVSIRNP